MVVIQQPAEPLAALDVELKATAADGAVTDSTSSFNALDQISQDNTTVNGSPATTTNYQYDLNGSLMSKDTVGGESYQYTYNLRNELATATINRHEQGHTVQVNATYKYNDAGIRVESDETTTIDNGTPTTQTKLFLIDANNPTGYSQILEQLTAVGSKPVMSYILGHQVIGQTTGSSAAQFLLADGHDSTCLVTDGAAALVARFAFDAYGGLLGSPAGVLNLPATSVLYTGQQFDPVLLEYYLRARYYDPSAGVFGQRDPFAGNVLVPLTLSKYFFAEGDPVNGTDPTGMEDLVSAMVTGAEIGALAGGTLGGVFGAYKSGSVFSWKTLEYALVGALAGAAAGAAIGGALYLAPAGLPTILRVGVRQLFLKIAQPAGHTLSNSAFIAGGLLGFTAGIVEPDLFVEIGAATTTISLLVDDALIRGAIWRRHDVAAVAGAYFLEYARTFLFTYGQATTQVAFHFSLGFFVGYTVGSALRIEWDWLNNQ